MKGIKELSLKSICSLQDWSCENHENIITCDLHFKTILTNKETVNWIVFQMAYMKDSGAKLCLSMFSFTFWSPLSCFGLVVVLQPSLLWCVAWVSFDFLSYLQQHSFWSCLILVQRQQITNFQKWAEVGSSKSYKMSRSFFLLREIYSVGNNSGKIKIKTHTSIFSLCGFRRAAFIAGTCSEI